MSWSPPPDRCFEARCRVTGLSYVGRTQYPVSEAWKRIVSQSKWGGKPLQEAIRQHGGDSFDVTRLAVGDRGAVSDVCRERLAQTGYWPHSYNLPTPAVLRRRRAGPFQAAAKEYQSGSQSRIEEEGSATVGGK